MRQVAVIGLGKFGSTVARELTERGAHVIAVDENSERVEDIKEAVTYAVVVDSVDENALRAVGIQNVDVAVVCIGEDVEANLLTTLLLRKIGVKKIWARAISPLQQEILKTMEVDNIINLEEEMGSLVANSLISRSISKCIPLTPGHSIAEIPVPRKLVGRNIKELRLRESYRINVVAVKKKRPQINDHGERIFEECMEHVPVPDAPLEETDVLMVIGSDIDIERFSNSA
ncbi:MAG TPA: TrkA family potassium uptake protein [Candidatus Omnitrophota bacterium]|nr:TrkA family potassium uptake protein [Candidatus Omnitrophota bacterium]MDD4941458.1 TrkA family potassium uptake protein [Candidatus Omnitrophota bacterium]HNQ51291.1 TrkA family potassium uptake protein [Candidatus Omnitrophota bacterium]HQO37583.1 TrkA family potassium uptake protein [Candidatus Omnitrophota bacterium]HQQ05503.1 TrkA family potassium uptake protein [Candidatus Omnitrophota bacterium]